MIGTQQEKAACLTDMARLEFKHPNESSLASFGEVALLNKYFILSS